jgi:UDPglucose 6-dehydrogenase
MNIAVVGTGYVGLVTGTCFADSGNRVICVDNDQNKLKALNKGKIPIYEPGLATLFERSTKEKRLTFTDNLQEAVEHAEIIFLCLPTPPGADGQADLQYVLQVAEDIGGIIKDYKIIVNKSTVPVGTADKVREKIANLTDVEFDVVSNPEFLREGAAVDDFLRPERVVIGTSSQKAAEKMQLLYEPFVRSGNPIIVMDQRSSELTKYAANSLLATKITFMNEVANLCERVGANVDNVRRGLGTDSRIGKRFLFAGIGYGGSCFPKDVQALDYTSDYMGYQFSILKSVMDVNNKQKTSIIRKMEEYYGDELKNKNIGMWGLAFKPETDDVREAPSLYIADELLKIGVNLRAYDPEATKNFKQTLGKHKSSKINFVNSPLDAIDGVDALIICTEWNEFRRPDFTWFQEKMKTPVIFDGRNLYDLERAKEAKLTYYSVGRPAVNGKK